MSIKQYEAFAKTAELGSLTRAAEALDSTQSRISHVLSAMNLPPEVIDSSFRISLCRDTAPEMLDALFEVLKSQILPRVR